MDRLADPVRRSTIATRLRGSAEGQVGVAPARSRQAHSAPEAGTIARMVAAVLKRLAVGFYRDPRALALGLIGPILGTYGLLAGRNLGDRLGGLFVLSVSVVCLILFWRDSDQQGTK